MSNNKSFIDYLAAVALGYVSVYIIFSIIDPPPRKTPPPEHTKTELYSQSYAAGYLQGILVTSQIYKSDYESKLSDTVFKVLAKDSTAFANLVDQIYNKP